MFSQTIFKQTLKANFKLWFIFTIITSAMLGILIAVFEPSTISGVTDMVKGTPLADLLPDTTALGMLTSTFYSIHGIILPTIFIIMTANSLIASQVDRGSMAYLLSTPTKRSTVVGTQALYLITSLLAMFLIVTVVGLLTIQISGLDINKNDFLLINLGYFLLMFATSGISFLFSCVCNLTKNSLAFGAGIPLTFFLFHMMSTMSGTLEKLKYVSMNSLFDTNAIMYEGHYVIQFITLGIVGIMLYIIGMRIFQRKDLPL